MEEASRAGMSQYELALNSLRAALDDGTYAPGMRLPPERDLAGALGVGRRTLRRALDLLEAEGRVWRHVGQGTFAGPRPQRRTTDIASLTESTNPSEIMEVRLEVEPRLAAFAALRATQRELAEIRYYAEKSESSTNIEAYEIWDSALHRAIALAAHNSLFLGLFDTLNAVRAQAAWGRLRESVLDDRRRRRYAADHCRLAEAIAERLPDEAAAQMQAHLRMVQRDLVGAPTSSTGERQERKTPPPESRTLDGCEEVVEQTQRSD